MKSLATTASLVSYSNKYMRTSMSQKHRQAIRVWMLVLLLQHEGGTDYRTNLDGLMAAYADREKLPAEQLDAFWTDIVRHQSTQNGVSDPTADELNAAITPLLNTPRLDHVEQALWVALIELMAGPQ